MAFSIWVCSVRSQVGESVLSLTDGSYGVPNSPGTRCRCCRLDAGSEPPRSPRDAPSLPPHRCRDSCTPPFPMCAGKMQAFIAHSVPCPEAGWASEEKGREKVRWRPHPLPKLSHNLLEPRTSRVLTAAIAALGAHEFESAQSRPCPRPLGSPQTDSASHLPARLLDLPRTSSGTSSPQKVPPGSLVAKVPPVGKRTFLLFLNGPGEGPRDWRKASGLVGRIKWQQSPLTLSPLRTGEARERGSASAHRSHGCLRLSSEPP